MRPRGTWLGALAAAGLMACSTPSVPIPPPNIDLSALTFNPVGAGLVALTGKADEMHQGAQFFVVDEASGDGVIAQAATDGSFTTSAFSAKVGDTIRVSLELGGRASNEYCVVLALGTPAMGDLCPPTH